MDILQKFKLYLIQGGRKQSTVNQHSDTLRRLLKSCPNLTSDEIHAFFLMKKENGAKNKYLNHYVDCLHLLADCLNKPELREIKLLKEEKFEQATMSDEEIEAFLNLEPPTVTRWYWKAKKMVTYQFDPKGWKVRTLFWKLVAWTGARPGEIAHLTVDNVDFGRDVLILEAEFVKTNTQRLVPIPIRVRQELEMYIKALDTNCLFPSKRGGQTRQGGVINDVDWGYDFHSRCKRLGIKRKNLRPYSLRPSFITRMLAEDVNIFKVQRIVGHRRITTTEHYTHLVTKDLQEAMKRDSLAKIGYTATEAIKDILDVLQKLENQYGHIVQFKLARDSLRSLKLEIINPDIT